MTSPLPASVDSVLAVLVPLLDEVPEAEDVNTGWWYVLVVFGLFFVVYLLWRSMRKQLKRIDFEEKPSPTTDAAQDTADRQDTQDRQDGTDRA